MSFQEVVGDSVGGMRGESQADILRRTGRYGVLPADTDDEAMAKLNAAAEAESQKAEIAADLAVIARAGSEMALTGVNDLIRPQNYFIDVSLSTAEAAVSAGQYFKISDTTTGLSTVYQRTADGSVVRFTDAPGFFVPLFELLGSVRVPAVFASITTGGYSVVGKGAARYARTNTPGAARWRRQSADGAWWELSHDGVVYDTQFGAVVDGESDDYAALQAAVDYITPRQMTLQLVPGRSKVSQSIVICDTTRIDRINFAIIGPGGDKAQQRRIIEFTNHASAYPAVNAPGNLNYGFIADYTRSVNTEQTGLQGVEISGFQIYAPNRGAALLLSECNNVTIRLRVTHNPAFAAGTQSLPRFGIVGRGVISTDIERCAFGNFQYAALWFTKSQMGSINKVYNDAVRINNNKFNGKSFALVITDGSTSFGTFEFKGNTKGGSNCSYGIIGGQGLSVDVTGSWLEHARCRFKSFPASQGSAMIPALEPSEPDIPDGIPYNDVLSGGWSFSYSESGVQQGNFRYGADLAGILSATSNLAAPVLTGGAVDKVEWNFKGPDIGFGGTRVSGPYVTGVVGPQFRNLQALYPNIAWHGYQGNGFAGDSAAGWRDDLPLGDHNSRMGSGTRPVKGSIARHFAVPSSGYSVFKLPMAFVGTLSAELHQTFPGSYETITQHADILIRGNATVPEIVAAYVTKHSYARGTSTPDVAAATGMYVGLVNDVVLGSEQTVTTVYNTTDLNGVLELTAHGLSSGEQIKMFNVPGLADGTGTIYRVERRNDNTIYLVDDVTELRVNTTAITYTSGGTWKKVTNWPSVYVGFAGRRVDASSGLIAKLSWQGAAIQSKCRFRNIAPEVFSLSSGAAAGEITAAGPAGMALQRIYPLEGRKTHNPSNLATGAGETTTVTVTGVALGDSVPFVSFSADLQGVQLTAWVSAADTVSVRFQNGTGGAVDLPSGTILVKGRSQYA